MGAAKAGFKPVPRVGSNARLDEDGGSGAQLILGFVIKVFLLGAVVFALVKYDLPIHVRNFVYGEPPQTGCCSCVCRDLYRLASRVCSSAYLPNLLQYKQSAQFPL